MADYLHRWQEVLRDLVTILRAEFLRWLPIPALAGICFYPVEGKK